MHDLHIADIYRPSNLELDGRHILTAEIRYLIAADSMCLSSFTFTQRAPEKTKLIKLSSTLQSLKVIQGHRNWYQS